MATWNAERRPKHLALTSRCHAQYLRAPQALPGGSADGGDAEGVHLTDLHIGEDQLAVTDRLQVRPHPLVGSGVCALYEVGQGLRHTVPPQDHDTGLAVQVDAQIQWGQQMPHFSQAWGQQPPSGEPR